MSPNLLLQYLPPFTGRREVLKIDQSVPDIIKEILQAHSKYGKHYQLIYPYFAGENAKETARNVFNFLKKHSDYVIEKDSLQTIKTPAAILATASKKFGGNDCKNLSLFSAGILEAYRQATGQNFDIAFRFAGYNGNDISHVFTVITDNGKEIWIDPVLNKFNDRDYIPTRYKDKKIENMALVGLSGIDPYQNNKAIFDNKPQPVPGVNLGVVPVAFAMKAAASAQKFVKAEQLAKVVQSIISIFGKKDAPGDYWKAWERIDQQYNNPIGSSAQHWIWRDGDSVQNEALNILSYIRNNDPDLTKVLSPNSTTLRDSGRYITFEDLLNKLRRGGYQSEAAQIKTIYDQLTAPPDQPAGTKKAGTNMLITLGLVGAAAFFLLNRKK